MPTIANGMDARGHKALMESRYNDAVSCFYRAHFIEPKNEKIIADLIYGLNQNGDFITALQYCYAYIGMHEPDGMILFLMAEALGGIGAIEGCGKMLRASLQISPDGIASEDARSFFNELITQYGITEEQSVYTGTFGVPMMPVDAAFLNKESAECVRDVAMLYRKGDLNGIKKRLEKELDDGNYSISVLDAGLAYGMETGNPDFIKRIAEGFESVEDYTLSEIRSLGKSLDYINDSKLAYNIYRSLYGKESGEREIAYGFAVACAKIGKTEQALSVIDECIAATGGIGAAARNRNDLAECSYALSYYHMDFDAYKESIEHIYESPSKLLEAFEYLRYGGRDAAASLLEKLNIDDVLTEEELRRLTIETDVDFSIRALAGQMLYDSGKKAVYINTGMDISEFHPDVVELINKLFERI